MVHYLTEEESPEVTSATLETLQTNLKNLGPAFIDHNIDRLMAALNKLLNNDCVCQTGADDDSDDADVNGMIFGNVTELLPIIAKTLRDGFVPSYKAIHKSLKKFMKENKGLDDIA